MYGLNKGCFWKRAKASLSEMDGDPGEQYEGSSNKRGHSPRDSFYTPKIDRPARIYPIIVTDKRGFKPRLYGA